MFLQATTSYPGLAHLIAPPLGLGASTGPAGAMESASGPVQRASQGRGPALSQRRRRPPDLDPGHHLTQHRGTPRDLGFPAGLTPTTTLLRPPTAGGGSPGRPLRLYLTLLFPSYSVETASPIPSVRVTQKGTSRLEF